jgi:hypothetical protein
VISALAYACLHCDAPRRTDPRTEAATGKAVAFLNGPARYGHAGFYFLHFLHRRFEIEAFAGAADRYWQLTKNAPRPFTGVDVFERLIAPGAGPYLHRLTPATHHVDRITAAALYCDEVPVADDYEARLEAIADEGGYGLTHAALAIEWLEENGCDLPSEALRDRVIERMAAGLNVDDRLDDIEIESAAFLYYLDRADRVPSGFPEVLLRAQNPDGGWPELWPDTEGKGSDWHPTVLALWVLLESEGRSNGAPMIPPAPAA